MGQTASRVIPRRMLLAGFVIGAVIAAIAYGRAQNSLDVVYVPTPQETVDRMLEVAEVGPKDYVIDLGSGDGRIAIAAGRRGARAIGVELDPIRLSEAEANLKRAGVAGRVSFRRQNLFETDLSPATVLTMYLLPSINLKLRPTILKLRPGTRVVSHDFAMGDWKPDLTETVNWRIHFWVVPAQVAGNWTVATGNQRFGLTLTQSFQEFRGTATVDGRAVPLRETKLRGGEIDFTVDVGGRATRFRGAVTGDGMQGAGGQWSAKRS
jgi:SAM-dependent methyltransferase